MNRKALLIAGLLITTAATTVQAHPGRTAADGCHFCRTNCSSWGVPAGQRYCHGGGGLKLDDVYLLLKTSMNSREVVPHNHDGAIQNHTHESNGKTTPLNKSDQLL